MKTVLILTVTLLGGLASHGTKRVIDANFKSSDVYQRLASYAVGLIMMQPFALLMGEQLEGVDNEVERQLLTNVTTATMFGMGVLLGYLFDFISVPER